MTQAGETEAPSAAERKALEEALAVQLDASVQQHKAADPQLSVFVNANAGSGKTYLLVNRVIRLLLDGARPENILCLTYTRAAATEMRTRLFDRLAKWIDMDDAELLRTIREVLDHRDFPDECLHQARRLFAMALETPGGLRVQTIHAFCERLLQAFPVEAGMPPGFEVMDEAETRALLMQARRTLLAGGGIGTDAAETAEGAAEAQEPVAEVVDAAVRERLALLATQAGEERLQKLLEELLRYRRLLARMNADVAVRERVLAGLRRLLALGENEPLEEEAWIGEWARGVDVARLRRWVEALRPLALQARDRKQPEKRRSNDRTVDCLHDIARALEDGRVADAWQRAQAYLLTRKNEPRKQLFTKEVKDAAPALMAEVEDFQQAVWLHHVGVLARRAYRVNEALLRVGMGILDVYEKEKAWRGKFDYDDLILRTLELLRSVDAPWVLYRLDGGIDHVLVDEAQDTSPEQWEILRLLTEEFTSGAGARQDGAEAENGRRRTVFAVGDVKQSIYSFQGAAPEAFHHMRELFRHRHEEAKLPFEEVPLKVSFRTVQEVLDVVDEVLHLPDFRLGEDKAALQPHQSARPHVHGFVELWPLERADDDAAGDDDGRQDDEARLRQAVEALWTPPAALEVSLKPRLKLAARIADTIRRWLDEGEALPPDAKPADGPAALRDAQPRRIRPRDILILVRNRTTLMEAIISALKQRGIAVAGADRLKVTEHIAVQDMLALLRFLLLPADDLSLAAVLKSPLLARDDGRPLDDDDLLRLRGGLHDFDRPLAAIEKVDETRPLWTQLQEAERHGAPLRGAVRRLQRWRRMAGFLPPYEMLAHVLWRDGGLRRFVARLGEEAVEPLEALLDLALHFEREEGASLSAFVQWLEAEEPQIKRELEAEEAEDDGPGAVRVMTVHGAKGLEAPIVFLADTTSVPDRGKVLLIDAPLLDEEGQPEGEELPLWPMKEALQPPTVQKLVELHQRRQEEEYNRLLYVAMTRAADRLYVCGAADGRKGAEQDGAADSDGDGRKGGKKKGKKAQKEGRIRSWHEWLSMVMCRDECRVRLADGRHVWRWPVSARGMTLGGGAVAEKAATEVASWLHEDAPQEPGPALWLAPSRVDRLSLRDAEKELAAEAVFADELRETGDDPVLSPLQAVQAQAEAMKDPLRRGVLVHQLLQYLPDLPPSQRRQRALAWLRHVQGLEEDMARALWAEVEGVLQAEPMALLFGPGSRAEVPFAARLRLEDGREVVVNGQIDRLVVRGGEVLVADFKTARPVPRSVEEVAAGHVRQMALYREAVRGIWPDHAVRCVLIHTAGPAWLELPEEVLTTAL